MVGTTTRRRRPPGCRVAVGNVELISLIYIASAWKLRERPNRLGIAIDKLRRVRVRRKPQGGAMKSRFRPTVKKNIFPPVTGVRNRDRSHAKITAWRQAVKRTSPCAISGYKQAVLR